MSGLAVGDSLYVRDLVLRAGLVVLDDEDTTLATVSMNTLGAELEEADAAAAAAASADGAEKDRLAAETAANKEENDS